MSCPLVHAWTPRRRDARRPRRGLSLAADPLPSWNDTDAKAAIAAFVDSDTDTTADTFVPEDDRIAVFDNDGTLWAKQPMYFQALYALDVLREKATEDPSILTSDVLHAANEGDKEGMVAGGQEGLLEIINVSHGGITADAFERSAHEWLTTATHPTTGMTYASMTYQPMLELLSYLRDEDFTTYIVSGGGIDFIRAIADEAYGIPRGRWSAARATPATPCRTTACRPPPRTAASASSTTRRASPSPSPATSASVRSSPPATPTATSPAGMDHCRRRPALRVAGPPHRRRPRVRLRPRGPHRRPRPGRGPRLVGRRHGRGLGTGLAGCRMGA